MIGIKESRLEKYLMDGIRTKVYPACAARVVWDQKVVFSSTYGVTDPQKQNEKITEDTLFDLASLTKVIVATAFMKLTQKGVVRLNEHVCSAIPEMFEVGKEHITYLQLLTHSSGLPASFNLYENNEWDKGKEHVIRKLLRTKLDYVPGSKVVYSCLGYMLLGYAMEQVTGLGLEQIIEELLEPFSLGKLLYKPYLDYSNIAITTYSRPNRGPLYAGVVHDGNAIALSGGISGNAGLFGSLNSVSAFADAFVNYKLLPKDLTDLMTSCHIQSNGERRGIGWQLWSKQLNNPGRILSRRSYGHKGFTGTSLWIDPENKVVITLLTNSVHYYTQNNDRNKFYKFVFGFHKLVCDYLGIYSSDAKTFS